MKSEDLDPGNVTRQFVSGDYAQAAQGRFDQKLTHAERAGDHVWVAIASYGLSDDLAKAIVVGDPEAQPILDSENLAGIHFGCYRCERALERRLVGRRCAGEPR